MTEATETRGAASGETRRAAPRTPDAALLIAIAVFACCLALVSAAVLWRAAGGRWAVVDTPSMGQAVPVGTLILTRPRALDALEPGDVVTYRPPPNRSLYAHRVVGRDHLGVRVQGDLNGAPDPYPVTADNLVGKVVAHWRAVGYVVRALPFLLVAGLVLAFGSRLLQPRWRSTVRVLGGCLAVTICILVLRPFVRPVLMGAVPAGEQVQATVVSAGLFPTRIAGAPGEHIDLLCGQVGSVLARPDQPGGPAMIVGTPHLTGWWLVGYICACLVPLVWCLAVGLSPLEVDQTVAAETPDPDAAAGDAP